MLGKWTQDTYTHISVNLSALNSYKSTLSENAKFNQYQNRQVLLYTIALNSKKFIMVKVAQVNQVLKHRNEH